MPNDTNQPQAGGRLAPPATPETDRCLSVKEVCAYLSIGRTTYYKLRNQGEIETFLLLGKRLTQQSAIDAYIVRKIAQEIPSGGNSLTRGSD